MALTISDKNACNHDDYYPAMLHHVTREIVVQRGEKLLAVLSLAGSPHETTDHYKLVRSYNHLNTFFRTLGRSEGSNLAIWTWLTKRRINIDDQYLFDNKFCQALADKYIERFRDNEFYEVRYSIALVLKYSDLEDGIKRISDMLRRAKSSLKRYDVSILGLSENERGVPFSEIGAFFSRFFNGYERPIPLSDNDISDSLIDSYINFETDFIEIRPNKGGHRYAATYDLREYPSQSGIGMWDEILSVNCEFTLTQSLQYVQRNKSKKMLETHTNNLESSEGESEQVKELKDAQEYITSGRLQFGNYHGALVVYADSRATALDRASKIIDAFSLSGADWVRSTGSNLYTFFSQFPAAHEKNIPFPEPKTTRNLVSGFSLHSMPSGKQYGNPVGDGTALMPMMTDNAGAFFFSNHNSPLDQDNTGEPFAGHTLILGATGTGKTTLEGVMTTFTDRFNPMLFVIDYNQSNENLLRALHTHYVVIRRGENTNIQPFQFPDSPKLRSYLYELVETAAGGSDVVTGEESGQIKVAVDAVMNLSVVSQRRFSTVLQMIPPKGGNSLYVRLSKWCAATNGKLAWALDSPENHFNPADYQRLAFDATDIMKEPDETTEAVLSLLFFTKELMHEKGGFLLNLCAEFWVPANFPTTAKKMKDILKAGRMRLEYLILDSQSPEDAISCTIFDAIIQMTPTKMFLPNSDASWAGYKKCGLTRQEYNKLAELDKYSRKLLLKQGHQSCILDYGLYDFDDFLPVISSTKENVQIAAKIREELNTNDPDIWVPAFQAEMRRQRENQKAPSRKTSL
ncbi:conjugal transfer protein [Salmonella enterica]